MYQELMHKLLTTPSTKGYTYMFREWGIWNGSLMDSIVLPIFC